MEWQAAWMQGGAHRLGEIGEHRVEGDVAALLIRRIHWHAVQQPGGNDDQTSRLSRNCQSIAVEAIELPWALQPDNLGGLEIEEID